MNRRIDIRIVTPDGHRPYLEAVEAAFGMDIDYAVLQARCRRSRISCRRSCGGGAAARRGKRYAAL